MLIYLVRRAAAMLITILLAVTLVFVALRLIPGDAIEAQLAGGGATPAQIALRRAALGLDEPLIGQYGDMLLGLLRGDLGRSLISERPVSEIMAEQFGATVTLTVAALFVAVLLGIGLGLLAALNSSRVVRELAMALSSLALASPVVWTGTLAIYGFSVWLRVLPSAGSGDLRHLILPAGVLGYSVSGGIARITAASVRETREADYVRTAHAKGLRSRGIALRHILRPSLPPILTVIALQTGFLLGGAAITETLFVRQGIGQLLISAINDKDYPVVQGIVMLSALAYSVVNTSADVLAALIDPRRRLAPE